MRKWIAPLVLLMACEPVDLARFNGRTMDGTDIGSYSIPLTGAVTNQTGQTTGTGTGAVVSTGTGTGLVTSTGTGTGVTTTVTVPTGSSTISAICAPTANELRQDCQIIVDPPQAVDISYWPDDGTGTVRTWGSNAVTDVHDITVYLMRPDTTFEYLAIARADPTVTDAGTFDSSTLPAGCDVNPTWSGTSTAEFMVVQSPCITGANFIVFETRTGDVVWCQDFRPTAVDPVIEGGNLTEDDTIIGVLADHVMEFDFFGNELTRLARATDFTNHVHHDASKHDGLIFALFNERVNYNNAEYDLDGVYVFDNGALVNEWHLFDHFQPANQPVGWPGRDYSHGNSVEQDDDGNISVSMRHLSAVVNIMGDPYDPNFGDINWRMAGETTLQEFGNDFTMSSSAGVSADFERQHNAHYLPDGTFTLFDNRDGMLERSRLLHLDLDTNAMTADIFEAWELPVHCDFQGGAKHMSNGNALATCAPIRAAYEFEVGNPDPIYDVSLSCQGGLNTYTPRFMPFYPDFSSP